MIITSEQLLAIAAQIVRLRTKKPPPKPKVKGR